MAIPRDEQWPEGGTVIQLEGDAEEAASEALSDLIDKAQEDKALRPAIRALWDNESWDSIMRKCRTEGSTWYVWWMDGVHALMAL